MNQRTITLLILGCLAALSGVSLDASFATRMAAAKNWVKANPKKTIGFIVGAAIVRNFIGSKLSKLPVGNADMRFKMHAGHVRRRYQDFDANQLRRQIQDGEHDWYHGWRHDYGRLMVAGQELERALERSYETYWTRLFGPSHTLAEHPRLRRVDALRENDEKHYHAELIWPVAPGQNANRPMIHAPIGRPLTVHQERWLAHMADALRILGVDVR